MIPPLTGKGVLPPGFFVCTLEEIESEFVTSDHRRELWNGLIRYVKILTPMKTNGLVESIVFGGSFVTSKDKPKDIDVLVEVTMKYAMACLSERRFLLVFEEWFTREFSVQAKPWNPTARDRNNLLLFFQTPSDEDIEERGLAPDDEKGVLRVVPWPIVN